MPNSAPGLPVLWVRCSPPVDSLRLFPQLSEASLPKPWGGRSHPLTRRCRAVGLRLPLGQNQIETTTDPAPFRLVWRVGIGRYARVVKKLVNVFLERGEFVPLALYLGECRSLDISKLISLFPQIGNKFPKE